MPYLSRGPNLVDSTLSHRMDRGQTATVIPDNCRSTARSPLNLAVPGDEGIILPGVDIARRWACHVRVPKPGAQSFVNFLGSFGPAALLVDRSGRCRFRFRGKRRDRIIDSRYRSGAARPQPSGNREEVLHQQAAVRAASTGPRRDAIRV